MNIELDKVVCHFKTDFPETRIVQSMLVDLFPKEGAERNLLTTIYDSGYVEKLASMPQCTQNNIDAAVSAIILDTFLAEQPVREALSMWLVAYGKNVSMIKVEGKYEHGNYHFQKESSEKEKFNLENVKVGSIIKFGRYIQNKRDKSEPIEWRVLDVRDGKALLISQYGLESKRYNIRSKTSWEKCILRKWLNSDFLNIVFSTTEQSLIQLSKVTNVIKDKNRESIIVKENDTEDRIFLLSIKEAEQYFKSDEDRKCKTTKIAISNGVDQNNNVQCSWWLRSLGFIRGSATYVRVDGSLSYSGNRVSYRYFVVRPALWINLKS